MRVLTLFKGTLLIAMEDRVIIARRITVITPLYLARQLFGPAVFFMDVSWRFLFGFSTRDFSLWKLYTLFESALESYFEL